MLTKTERFMTSDNSRRLEVPNSKSLILRYIKKLQFMEIEKIFDCLHNK